MNIFLKDFPVLYLNLDEQTERSESTNNVLSKYFNDITRVSAYRGYQNPGPGQELLWVAQAKSFAKAVNHYKPPFILFEDDIKDRYFINSIDVPNDADAIFLGGSVWGEGRLSEVSATKYDNVVKVHNMYTMHAILFLSNDLINEYSERLLSNEGICDVVFNHIIQEGNYNFYAINPPLFYQDDKNSLINSSQTRIANYLTMETFDV